MRDDSGIRLGFPVAELDISSPLYIVKSTDFDTVKNTYTIIYHYLAPEYPKGYPPFKVLYNYKTGYLQVHGRYAGNAGRITTGNYTYIFPHNTHL